MPPTLFAANRRQFARNGRGMASGTLALWGGRLPLQLCLRPSWKSGRQADKVSRLMQNSWYGENMGFDTYSTYSGLLRLMEGEGGVVQHAFQYTGRVVSGEERRRAGIKKLTGRRKRPTGTWGKSYNFGTSPCPS